ncbi:MAG TPA: endonuclease/exonuclease/phosphatase family protein [Planctomycetaceae bacterium]|nr:endonuclease/exonuclease/phosphatase family protein [Planctomycetaceae bacterium]
MTESPQPTRRGRVVTLLLAAALVAVVIRDGADRRPADPSRPLIQWLSGTESTSDSDTLRIVSFNIHSGKGDGDVVDLRRTAKTLDKLDFAGLYEVRGGLLPNGNQAAQISDNLYVLHSHSRSDCGSIFAATETHWWREHFGNAVLSYCELGTVQRIPLPGTRGKAFRNVVLSELPWRDRTVRILSTHIDREDDREMQLELVIALFLSLEPPAVLMGDLNTTIDDPQLTRLRERTDVASVLHDALPDGPPADTIDWMFTRGLRTVSAELTENAASDHPVLRAELALPE